MKNVVYILNVDLKNGRNNPYHYSVNSWKKWCEKNDVLFFEMTEFIIDPKELHINTQKWWALDVLDLNLNEPYDQVCVVDADTIVHPDCPNFFNETDGEFGVVVNNGCYEWVTRSIRGWGDALFPEEPKIKTWEYWNSGFVVYSKTHKPYIKCIQDYFMENNKIVEEHRKKILASADQTICNYLLNQNNFKVKRMPECYNFQDLFRKNLLHMPGHSWWSDELIFLEAGWIYHYCSIPGKGQQPRHVDYWMERTYKELYEK